jgi:hypothetical protein
MGRSTEADVEAGRPPVELGEGYWKVAAGDRDGAAPDRLRRACLQALDRGAESLAVDLTGSLPLSPGLVDVLVSADEVVRARGGTLALWAHGTRGALVVRVAADGVEAAAERLDLMERRSR